MDFIKKLLFDWKLARLAHWASTARGVIYALVAVLTIIASALTAIAEGEVDSLAAYWDQLLAAGALLMASLQALFGTTDNDRTD